MAEPEIVALIMAGGSGTRFWPLSRTDKPKQYLSLVGNRTLIQQTADRVAPIVGDRNIFVCSSTAQEKWLRQQLPPSASLILEPAARNTAPCLMLSALSLIRRGYADETTMVVLPSDHFIGDLESFRTTIADAVAAARERQGLVLLGIVPDRPHTGYGYIERGAHVSGRLHTVKRFVEKPDRVRAEAFLKDGGFQWNSGIFIWTLSTICQAFDRFLGESWRNLLLAKDDAAIATAYAKIPAQPIDIAVLEKADNVYVVPTEMGWSDIGSWDALYHLLQPTLQTNTVISGEVKSVDSGGCLVHVPPGRKVALVGVQDLVIVEDGDTILVVARDQDQKVRQAAQEFSV